ncbi:MAG: N-acetylmuramoyl-L-alanine amidase, partial [Alphaproteobacteria bacterium]|nr:N-acetylmuramoyl-L-alanine amidase [Alphaproteobacteria bacterium]
MRGSCFFLIFFILLTIFPAYAAGSQAVLQIEGIRYSGTGVKSRIVLDLNRKTDFRAFMLGDPYRVVLDLPVAEWKTFRSRFISDSIVKSYRSGELNDGLTRVIFDIKKSAVIANIFTLGKDGFNKDRLVIDLEKSSFSLFDARKGNVFGNRHLKVGGVFKTLTKSEYRAVENNIIKASVPTSASVPLPKRKPGKYTIVIDPGHGGGDPGAVSNGVKEKTITLAVALELRRQLEETGRYKVVMTRNRDVYVKLHERVEIARRMNGDLFISIHADKINRSRVRGASVYTLSEKASDAETERLADDENNSGFVAGVDLSQETQDVANILLDLAMR